MSGKKRGSVPTCVFHGRTAVGFKKKTKGCLIKLPLPASSLADSYTGGTLPGTSVSPTKQTLKFMRLTKDHSTHTISFYISQCTWSLRAPSTAYTLCKNSMIAHRVSYICMFFFLFCFPRVPTSIGKGFQWFQGLLRVSSKANRLL